MSNGEEALRSVTTGGCPEEYEYVLPVIFHVLYRVGMFRFRLLSSFSNG
ncbi:MAG: hypothetical protein ACLU4N_15130 [Butyricimonas faecihominis]